MQVHDTSNESSEAGHWDDDTAWLDKWWPLFLILFGISVVLLFALFQPSY